jgi:hypothetical protein
MQFGLHLECRLSMGKDKEIFMDDEKWAQELARQVRERNENQRIQKNTFLAEENLKKAHAPKLWMEIRSSMKKKMELLNETLGEVHLHWLSVKESEVRIGLGVDRLNSTDGYAAFDPATLEINTQPVASGTTYKPVIQNGNVVFVSKAGHVETPEQIAQGFISAISKFITL